MKTCTKCKVEKEESEFIKGRNVCIICYKLYHKQYINNNKEKRRLCKRQYYENNPNYKKEYYVKNKDKIILREKLYNDNNSDHIRELRKKRNIKNREKNKIIKKTYIKNNKIKNDLYVKSYKEKNKIKIAQQHKEYRKNYKKEINIRINERYYDDIHYRLSCLLRARLKGAIKKDSKTGSAVRDLGCSIEELKLHLESKFYPNPETGEPMSWDNHGLYGWHIDHIVPLNSFDLSNREQLVKACHYTNLQPLWAKENLSKSNKIV